MQQEPVGKPQPAMEPAGHWREIEMAHHQLGGPLRRQLESEAPQEAASNQGGLQARQPCGGLAQADQPGPVVGAAIKGLEQGIAGGGDAIGSAMARWAQEQQPGQLFDLLL